MSNSRHCIRLCIMMSLSQLECFYNIQPKNLGPKKSISPILSDRKRSRQSSAILRKRVQSSIKFSKQIFVSLCRSGLLTSRVTGPLRTDPTRPGIRDPRPKTRVKGCRRRHHMMAENLFGELFCKLRTHCEKKCCQSKLLTFLFHTPRLFLHLPTDGVARIFITN